MLVLQLCATMIVKYSPALRESLGVYEAAAVVMLHVRKPPCGVDMTVLCD